MTALASAEDSFKTEGTNEVLLYCLGGGRGPQIRIQRGSGMADRSTRFSLGTGLHRWPQGRNDASGRLRATSFAHQDVERGRSSDRHER